MNDGSWKSDLLRLAILAGFCLLLGVYLIRETTLITRDGVFYLSQAQQFAGDPVGVARRHPPGYPFLLWIAHEVAASLAGSDSIMLWVYSAQVVTLLCRALALIPLYFLGKALVGAAGSFWALLILLALPYPAQHSSGVLREWPHLLFLSLGLWLLYRALHERRWWLFALVGLDAGLGYLIRPECAQLIVYGLLGLACLWGAERGVRNWTPAGAGLLLLAGFLLPVIPGIHAMGTVLPHQLQPTGFNAPPVISAVGPKAAADDPLEFEIMAGELLELPIQAGDPHGKPVTLSLLGVPVGSRPVYEFHSRFVRKSSQEGNGRRGDASPSRFWTMREDEKYLLLVSHARQAWSYAGIVCYAYAQPEVRPGLLLVRRFWAPVLQRHFYTASEAEVRAIVQGSSADSWTYEGIAFCVFGADAHPPDTVPVYRSWSEETGFSWTVQGDDAKSPGQEGRGAREGLPSVPDPQAPPPMDTIVWYVPVAGAPPAGAVIGDGALRWRPGPDQVGEHQVSIIVSDGRLQSCQLVKITVVRAGDRGTEDGGRPLNPQSRLPRFARNDMIHHPQSQHAGLERLPTAVDGLFDGLTANLMVVFFVPWLVGLYGRLRHEAGRWERVLIPALLIVNVALILGRHIGLEPGSDTRYSLGLTALTIFYVPVGMEIIIRLIARAVPCSQGRDPRGEGRKTEDRRQRTDDREQNTDDRRQTTEDSAVLRPPSSVFRAPIPAPQAPPLSPLWFYLLVGVGIAVCLPKLLTSGRADKTGYRAAAEWLRHNTPAGAVVAVPDNRISFYAARQGLPYVQYPDFRRVDYVVAVAGPGDHQVLEGWRQEYTTPLDQRTHDRIVVVYARLPAKH